jgi:beta-lactamase class A
MREMIKQAHYLVIIICTGLALGLVCINIIESKIIGYSTVESKKRERDNLSQNLVLSSTDQNIPDKNESIKIIAGETDTTELPFDNYQLIDNLPEFVSISEKTIVITPDKNIQGNFSFSLNVLAGSNTTYKHTYNIKVLPPNQNLESLNQQILSILSNEQDLYAFYIYDLKNNKELSHNETISKPPASISKIPYAILTLRDIQSEKHSLDSTYPIQESYKPYETDGMYFYPNGSQVKLSEYLERLITQSDNTAMEHLEAHLGGYEEVNRRIKDELGLENLTKYPHETNAENVKEMFKKIYFQEYLDEEHNEYLLNLLMNTDSRFDDRIVEGVANKPDAKVAHKIGQIDTDNGQTYHDAGIIYGKNTDIIIVVLNEDIDPQKAKTKISDITKLVYETLN